MKSSSPSLSRHQLKALRLAGFASSMRRTPTRTERVLWNELSAGKLGVSFRPQIVVAGGLIVDLLAPAEKLIVEVDGAYHAEPRRGRADARRDRKLEHAGYRVLRLSAELVLSNLPEALRRVREALAACSVVRQRGPKP